MYVICSVCYGIGRSSEANSAPLNRPQRRSVRSCMRASPYVCRIGVVSLTWMRCLKASLMYAGNASIIEPFDSCRKSPQAMTWMPPKGALFIRARRAYMSNASIIYASSNDTSSIMRTSTARRALVSHRRRILLPLLLLSTKADEAVIYRGTLNAWWNVHPPSCTAATPVVAVMATRNCNRLNSRKIIFSNTVLPVPALPPM